MLAIGRALIAQPRLMLLDEPSLGLSPMLVENIFSIIARINAEQGVSMLLVEQNASVALAVAHYGYIMETGKVVIDGTADKLAADPDVREFYLGVAAQALVVMKDKTVIASLDTAVWPELTLPQMLREQARRQPSAIAIRQKDFGIWKPLTWADYWQRACRVGLGLRALGLSRGGRVAIVSENRVEWLLTQLGAGAVGGVAVGVYSTSPAEEMGYVLEHADVELVVACAPTHPPSAGAS
ncbi:hypothetical protein G6F31_015862 [Rhizopus arrhizus]|nr:hypothetical protein G6F31_015862 [Rhizopus arrhizus]